MSPSLVMDLQASKQWEPAPVCAQKPRFYTCTFNKSQNKGKVVKQSNSFSTIKPNRQLTSGSFYKMEIITKN